MAHASPEFETQDILGKTLPFTGNVGTSNLTLPVVSQGKISDVLIRNPDTNLITKKLFLSFDGGTTFFSLSRGEFIGWSPKNNASNMPINQIVIKGSAAATDYEIIINVEP
jgi:hypothetical protein